MDVSAIITPGVYILRHLGRVVFVGAGKNPLARLYAHANHRRGEPAPRWLPGRPITFDAVELRPATVDNLSATYSAVCAELSWAPTPSPVTNWRATANA